MITADELLGHVAHEKRRRRYVRLTPENVSFIRRTYAAGGYTYRSIAAILGCGFATVRDVVKGKIHS